MPKGKEICRSVIILDGHYHLYRFASIVGYRPDVVPSVFFRLLLTSVRLFPPPTKTKKWNCIANKVIVTFDHGVCFRRDVIPTYKMHRSRNKDHALAFLEILKRTKRMCMALGVPIYPHPVKDKQSRAEADDVMETLVSRLRPPRADLRIVHSVDKDMAYSLRHDNHVVQVRDMSGAAKQWIWKKDVKRIFGVSAERMPHHLALRGDSADGIPPAKTVSCPQYAKNLKVTTLYDKADIVPTSLTYATVPFLDLSERSLRRAMRMDKSLELLWACFSLIESRDAIQRMKDVQETKKMHPTTLLPSRLSPWEISCRERSMRKRRQRILKHMKAKR